MDDRRFDALTRAFARGTSRRTAIKGLIWRRGWRAVALPRRLGPSRRWLGHGRMFPGNRARQTVRFRMSARQQPASMARYCDDLVKLRCMRGLRRRRMLSLLCLPGYHCSGGTCVAICESGEYWCGGEICHAAVLHGRRLCAVGCDLLLQPHLHRGRLLHSHSGMLRRVSNAAGMARKTPIALIAAIMATAFASPVASASRAVATTTSAAPRMTARRVPYLRRRRLQ